MTQRQRPEPTAHQGRCAICAAQPARRYAHDFTLCSFCADDMFGAAA